MKNVMTKTLAVGSLVLASSPLFAAEYVIDSQGAHAAVEFKINHLGFSWLNGRFNNFEGTFSYDPANPSASTVAVEIDTESVDSNHAERDKHLRSKDFLDVSEFPMAKFVSTSFEPGSDNTATVQGDLTLHGVTKPVTMAVTKMGEGDSPWGDYRMGFEGTAEIKLKDFGIDYNLGPAAETVYLELYVEGIRGSQ